MNCVGLKQRRNLYSPTALPTKYTNQGINSSVFETLAPPRPLLPRTDLETESQQVLRRDRISLTEENIWNILKYFVVILNNQLS